MNPFTKNPPIEVSDAQLARVHMVGIGGAGMSGVARILIDRGYTVTGSDMKDSRPILALRAAGATIAIGHDAANLELAGELPTVVVTSYAAIPATNPELVRARELGIPVVKRSDILGALLRGYTSILLAGTHGKTSSTSMSVVALQQAGLDPSFAIGGQLSRAGTNAHHGTGTIFVAEADESDASLLTYEPTVAVVTNVEADHLDFYGTAEAYHEAFDRFAERVIDGGYLVVCVDDPGAAALGERVATSPTGERIHVCGYGRRENFANYPHIPATAVVGEIRPGPEVTEATVYPGDGFAGFPERAPESFEVRTYIPGDHMVLNAVAAIVADTLVGAPLDAVLEGIGEFRGVRRRFDYHGTVPDGPFAGASVYDDYAHHPTEVRAVLTAARERAVAAGLSATNEARRVIVCFQPHLYSRTQQFAAEFAKALSLADEALILDIYGAREEPIDGVTSDIIISRMTIPTHAAHRIDDVADAVASIARPGDLILTMGAGTVTMLADPILDTLRAAA